MNQRFDPTENRSANPAAFPAEQAGPRIDPVTGLPVNADPLTNQRRPEDIEPRKRSSWPILIILLAGLVLALLVWLPAELSTDATNDAATPSAATEPATTTPPADNAAPATAPADNSATPGAATPDTTVAPNTAPAAPDAPAPATGAAPATGTDQQAPATGTAP